MQNQITKIKRKIMKNIKYGLVMLLIALLTTSAFASEKEGIQATLNNAVDSFNNIDHQTYLSLFVDDNTAFSYVVSSLLHDAAAWKAFIMGTANLEYVNYQSQDNLVQVYNDDSAVVTGYYTFKWMEKGGLLQTQNGRATTVLIKKNGKWLIAHMHFSKLF